MLSKGEKEYVLEKIVQGRAPDVIEGRREEKLSMSSRTGYRRFREDPTRNVKELPMKGKRKQNGQVEKRVKQAFRRS